MSVLLNAAVKVTAILLVGFLVAALLRRRSAAMRHWVLAAAVVCAAVTPILGTFVPAWRVPATSWSSAGRAIDPSEWITPREADLDAAPGPVARGEAAPAARVLTPARALAALWLLGVVISLSALAAGLARLSRLASRAQPISTGPWADGAARVSRAFGLARPVTLLQSDHPTLLVTWGLRRPRVILPAAARDWPEERVRVVLCHELAHVRRGDWAVQLIAELLRSAYWFNPLLWIACRRVRQESEHACDDAVLGLGIAGPEYAAHLLDVARSFRAHRHLWSPALAIARPSSLERRVRAMLNARLDRNPITRTACTLAGTLLLAAAIPIAGFTVFADAASTTLTGTVVDQLGRGIPDVTLGLSDAQTRARHEVHTDQTGRFTFVPLPAGEYALDAKQPGFTTLQATVTLTGPTMRRDLTLQLGTIHESITVSSNNPPRSQDAAKAEIAKAAALRQRDGNANDPCLNSPTGGCLRAPLKIRDVKPIYPEGLLATKAQGTVKLNGQIATDGSVANLQVVDASDPAFGNAALDAVGQWQFTPTHLDGTPVDTQMIVVVTFKQP